MSRSVLFLLAAVLALSVTVVELRHRSRLLFAELQALRAERDALNVEWGQLLLEEGTWSEHRRIERLARERLDMGMPDSEHIVVVRPEARP
jgi:cell division protein FtsL